MNIKKGDKVCCRWNDSMQWTTCTFIGETDNGFEAYNFTIEDNDHIEYYAQICVEPYKNHVIYYSKKFKDRNYKNYNFQQLKNT